MASILDTGTSDFAAVEMVRASLEAGSSDNVTSIVADVVEGPLEEPLEPLLLGAAAELPRRNRGGVGGVAGMTGMFRGHRSGDTGEMEPVPAEVPGGAIPNDPIDPEVVRYAPRPPRRFVGLKRVAALAVVLGVIWIGAAAAYSWTQDQYYVSEHDGVVTIFRGVDANLPGVTLHRPYEESSVALANLSEYDARQVRKGIEADSLADARRTVENLARNREPASGDSGADSPSGASGDAGGTGGGASDNSGASGGAR
jgi:protein phosphatase